MATPDTVSYPTGLWNIPKGSKIKVTMIDNDNNSNEVICTYDGMDWMYGRLLSPDGEMWYATWYVDKQWDTFIFVPRPKNYDKE